MSSRNGSADRNGEDDPYGIGKSNTEQGCSEMVSEGWGSNGVRSDRHPIFSILVMVLKLKTKVGPVPAKV